MSWESGCSSALVVISIQRQTMPPGVAKTQGRKSSLEVTGARCEPLTTAGGMA